MGRTMTPQEMLLNSSKLPVTDMFKATIVDSEGNQYPLYSADEIEALNKYPNFAASFSMFTQLWKDIPEPRREMLFDKMETLIKNVVVMDSLNDWRACPKQVKEWYLGENNFYYSEENDEKFYNWIISNVAV